MLDLEARTARRPLDWNTMDIDWRGRGADRGLRGVAIDGEIVYVAASDELFAYTPDFVPAGSWRSPFLKHCHEIAVWERKLYLTSTGFDSILRFDLDRQTFDWAIHIQHSNFRFRPVHFDPQSGEGPMPLNKLHINNVFCNRHGMYITGLRTGGMLHFNGRQVHMAVELPTGTHNARPFRDGVIFNDTEADALRYTGRGEGHEDRAMRVPEYDAGKLERMEFFEEGLARPGFARGLCVLSDRLVAGGSSPSTVTVYDLAANERLGFVNLSMDVRNAIHGLERWPFD